MRSTDLLSSAPARSAWRWPPRPATRAWRTWWWGGRCRSGSSTCRPACCCARPATGTWTCRATRPSRRSSRPAGSPPPRPSRCTRELYLDYCDWFAAREGDRRRATARAPPGRRRRRLPGDPGGRLGRRRPRRGPRPRHGPAPPGAGRAGRPAATGLLAAHLRRGRPGRRPRRRYLLVGGRQSAFEWAALLAEAGARQVDVVHRHDSPAFAAADWSWVSPWSTGWDRPRLVQPAQPAGAGGPPAAALGRGPAEGRAVARRPAARRPGPGPAAHQPAGARLEDDGSVRVDLDDGDRVVVDEVLLATGYQPHVDDLRPAPRRQPAAPGPAGRFPDLDDGFQTSVPGLYVTSLPAAGHFGPFFGFTIGPGCRPPSSPGRCSTGSRTARARTTSYADGVQLRRTASGRCPALVS